MMMMFVLSYILWVKYNLSTGNIKELYMNIIIFHGLNLYQFSFIYNLLLDYYLKNKNPIPFLMFQVEKAGKEEFF